MRKRIFALLLTISLLLAQAAVLAEGDTGAESLGQILIHDDGNLLTLEEAGDFDPTEALEILKDGVKEYEAALASIKPGGRYAIYTMSDGRGGEGTTRHYVRKDGRLTDRLSDSCVFTFRRFEGDTLYRSPAYVVCWYEQNEEGER